MTYCPLNFSYWDVPLLNYFEPGSYLKAIFVTSRQNFITPSIVIFFSLFPMTLEPLKATIRNISSTSGAQITETVQTNGADQLTDSILKDVIKSQVTLVEIVVF